MTTVKERQTMALEMEQKEVQVAVTQEDIRVIKQDVSKLSSTLYEVHQAIVGNSMSRDGGIVQRVIDLETEASILGDRVLAVEKKRIKTDLYIRIIWGCGGVIGSLITWLLSHPQ